MIYPIFFNKDEVTEIRSFGLRGKNRVWEGNSSGVVSGFFNDPEAFAAAAQALDRATGPGPWGYFL